MNGQRWFVQVQSFVHARPRVVGVYNSENVAAQVHAALAESLRGQLGTVRTSSPGQRSWLTLTRNGQCIEVEGTSPNDPRTMPHVYFEPGPDGATPFLRSVYAGQRALVTDVHLSIDGRDDKLYFLKFEDGTHALVEKSELA